MCISTGNFDSTFFLGVTPFFNSLPSQIQIPTFRVRVSSGPQRFGTRGDVSGVRYRPFWSWIKSEILRFGIIKEQVIVVAKTIKCMHTFFSCVA